MDLKNIKLEDIKLDDIKNKLLAMADKKTLIRFGIGFGLSEHGGYQKIGHGGAIYGFSTQLYAIPEINFGVATASSVDITNSITRKLSTVCDP